MDLAPLFASKGRKLTVSLPEEDREFIASLTDPDITISAPITDVPALEVVRDLSLLWDKGEAVEFSLPIPVKDGHPYVVSFPAYVHSVYTRSHPRWRHDRVEMSLTLAGSVI